MKTLNGLKPATWSGDRVLYIVQAGIIAAVYVVLTVVFAPFGFGEIQVRISEALTILPFFLPAAVPGLFIGCIIGNTLGGAVLPDILFGSLATLIGAVLTYLIGRRYHTGIHHMRNNNMQSYSMQNYHTSVEGHDSRDLVGSSTGNENSFIKKLILAALPPIIANAIIVPFVLRYAYGVPMPIPLMMVTVGVGEIISCGILGVILGNGINRIIR